MRPAMGMDSSINASLLVGPRDHRLFRWDLLVVAGFTAIYLTFTCLLAQESLLWYDELFTFRLAQLPHLADLWSSLAEGADASPPLIHLLTRFSQGVLGPTEIGTRFPAIVGYWVMSVSLYFFVVRRCRRPYALLAMVYPLATTVYAYSFNARPYGVLLGASGLSLLCWQAAADGRRRKVALAGLALSLTAAFASHYYAFLMWLPLALGETVRTRAVRRVDWPMWLALGAGPLSALAFVPLALGAKRGMSQFGFQPGWKAIAEIYLFQLKSTRLLLTLGIVTALAYSLIRRRHQPASSPGGASIHEFAAVLGLAAMPILGVAMGQWVTGMFTARYAAPGVIGIATLLAFGLNRSMGRNASLALLLAVLFLAQYVREGLKEYARCEKQRAEIAAVNERLKDPSAAVTAVVADPCVFLQLAHYAEEPVRVRLAYLSHPDASLRYNHTDPRDWALRTLRRWSNVPVYDYFTFTADRERFLVLGDSGWLRPTLEADGISCRPRGPSDPLLFDAEKTQR